MEAAAFKFPNVPGGAKTIPIEQIKDLYEQLRTQVNVESKSFEEVGSLPELDERLEKAKAYATRLSATPADSPIGHVFVNGKYMEYTPAWTHGLQQELGQQTDYLQSMVRL